MKRFCFVLAAVCGMLTLFACKHAPPAGVASEVNGHAITYSELEKFQAQNQQLPEGANPDAVMAQKLDMLGNLITNEIMWQQAEKLGLTAGDADVDTEFNKLKAPYTKEEFEKKLGDGHMTADDLKAQIRRKLTVDKLVNKEITSHITVTDAEIASFYQANKAMFNLPEPRIHMAQILVTPFPDPNVHNLKNSKAQNDAQAREKILDIEKRLKSGEDFAMIAQNYSEDMNSAPSGGDMGFLPESSLEKASPELRKTVDSLQPGSLSAIMRMQDGYRILKVISKEPAGQRDLEDPRVRQEIRENLLNQKDSLLKSAYYETQRNKAKVVNYLAQSIVEAASKNK